MSDESKALTVPEGSDFTEYDQKKVDEFIKDGMPGIAQVTDTTIYKLMDLYLMGKTYSEISQITNTKKVFVLYLSQRFDWLEARKQYIHELEHYMKDRLIAAKIESKDFLLQLTQMWQKKIGNKMKQYLASDNEQFANSIDLKEVDKYLKTVEMLDRLSNDGKGGSSKPSPIGLNLGDGVTITKKGDNSIEVTPKQNAISGMLKEWADYRREEENKKNKPNNDIINNETENQGEDPNETK